MFKLLARSTGLQKAAPGVERPPTRIPSAGGLPNDSSRVDIADHSVKPEEREIRGIKRKRRTVEVIESGIPEELDFFGAHGVQSKPVEDKNGLKSTIPDRGDGKILRDVGLDAKVLRMSEEECRQIFKKHKLKVTLLEHTETAQKQSRGIRSANTKNEQRKKDQHHQIWPQPLMSFKELGYKHGISSRLAENLDDQGYRGPTEVQTAALPLLLGSDADRGLVESEPNINKERGRSEVDLITVAPTGSGKTLAFLIPIIQGLVEDRRNAKAEHSDSAREHRVQALVLAPTHELVDQIVNEARRLAIGTGIKVSGMKKGMKVYTGLQDESNDGDLVKDDGPFIKVDVLVSTPLMTLHAISSPNQDTPRPLSAVRYLVLDEADVLLDPLFRSQTLDIWTTLTNPHLRTTLWSATIGSSIETLAQEFIHARRARLNLLPSPSSTTTTKHLILRLVVGLKDTALPQITHQLTYAASEQGKLLAIRQLLHPSSSTSTNTPAILPPFLIFTQTIPRATALHAELLYDIPPEAGGSSRIAVLHSSLSTTARAAIMTGLRKGEIWIVITTDLLSRGLDIRGLNGVVNYDIPTTGAAYVHRVGRTGRQGREGGVAVTLYTKEDIPYVKNVANVIAASERERAKRSKATGGEASDRNGATEQKGDDGGGGVQQWLLDALPKVSKKTKQELKRRGVESRRTGVGGDDVAMKRKGRISTKSGFERRMEERRRGAKLGSQRRKREERGVHSGGGDEEVGDYSEWSGFDG